MHWGHATTRDLLEWHHLPIALSPGDGSLDSFGCWSGCIIDLGSEARLFYTGVCLEGELRRASICQATSSDPDRIVWTKLSTGPIIDRTPVGIAPDMFRDPFVWREDGAWRMIVGAGTTDGRGTVLLYESADLDQWRFLGPILASDQVRHIPGADAPTWECPQLLRMGEHDVLIVSVVDPAPSIRPSHVMAFIGRLDHDLFLVDRGQRLTMGPDFYAPAVVRTPDQHWLLFGWSPRVTSWHLDGPILGRCAHVPAHRLARPGPAVVAGPGQRDDGGQTAWRSERTAWIGRPCDIVAARASGTRIRACDGVRARRGF